MLDKFIVRKLNLIGQCEEYRRVITAEQALTGIRLSRLLATQSKNPKWAAYDKYADAIVGINIRIEEQYAAAEELNGDLKLINDRENILRQEACYIGRIPAPHQQGIQLGLFDTAKKRKRIGVPC